MPCEKAYAVVVAAGSSRRMGGGVNKAFISINGKTALRRSLDALGACSGIAGVVLVAAAQETRQCFEEAADSSAPMHAVVEGGATRTMSVYNGLRALPEDAGIVLVHDAARPFVKTEDIARCIESVRERGSGVLGNAPKDTIKRVDVNGMVLDSPDRAALRAVQTPQAFRADWLRDAYERAIRDGAEATDDAALVAAAGYPVYIVEGDYTNIKITTPDDLTVARALAGSSVRVGMGFDAHRLVEGRPLVLCGVRIPYEKGLLGHSDADVATHALMDALLGAAGMGDIGLLFPDSDAQYRDIASTLMLGCVMQRLNEQGYEVINADITIVAQAPRIAPYRDAMARVMSEALGTAHVCVKATTTEGMGFTGGGEGIATQAVVLLETKQVPIKH